MLAAISPEALREQGPGRTQADVGEAWAEAHRQLRAALARDTVTTVVVMIGVPGAGKSTWIKMQPHDPRIVVFDAVFADRKRRAAMARRIRRAGKAAVAVWVQTPIDECLRRNALRPEWRRVPEPFIRRVAGQLQAAPPTTTEGWDKVLHIVHAGPVAGILP